MRDRALTASGARPEDAGVPPGEIYPSVASSWLSGQNSILGPDKSCVVAKGLGTEIKAVRKLGL